MFTKMIIETSREYLSISIFFTMFWFLHKLYELCVNHGHDFFENNIYLPEKFFPLFHQNIHLNLLRCRCRNTK